MRSFLRPILQQSLLVLLLVGPSAAQDIAPEDWLVEHLDWRGQLDLEHPVAVRNPEGDLRIRAGDTDEIQVLAVLQRHADDPRGAEISVIPASESADGRGDSHRIGMTSRGDATKLPARLPDAWRKRRVDMTVVLPADARLELETERGTLQAKGIAAPLVARSTHGDLHLVGSAAVEAHSDYGKVQLELRGALDFEAVRLSTRTGTIRLRLPYAASFRAELVTRGEITTDYSITVERRPGSELKDGRITTDPEGPLLRLESERGDLQIVEQYPPAPEPGTTAGRND